ncbi:2-methylthioadenine synthetase [Synergistales bacterium]|nr:2-methylthioadenine synthetase [Synergistales bacterium]
MSETLRGLRVWICALGCRSNIYEAEALAGELAARGASVSAEAEGCEVAVIVSCSVTATADRKCRQAVRRARRVCGVVAVCGCWAQALPGEDVLNLGIDILAGSRMKHLLPGAIEAKLASPGSAPLEFRGKNRDEDTEGDAKWDSLSLDRPRLRTRAFLKIQEGCDHFCSYCVIPFLRGRSVSRNPEDVLAEVKRVVSSGCREIVLTGIHLGDYRTGDVTLPDLIDKLSALPGLSRLRLGSLEPFALTTPLLDALADSPIFCRHLHLPAQSGDDGVLSRMRRGYKAGDFLSLCDLAREKLRGDLHISSDILVAFPGETESAFQNTMSLMERAALGRVHVFPYSPRKGTEAWSFGGRVEPRVASDRVAAAASLGERLLSRYASRFIGATVSILAESEREGVLEGYSRNFLSVEAEFDKKLEIGQKIGQKIGREVDVLVRQCANGKLKGARIQ